jgi:hypothetical protein
LTSVFTRARAACAALGPACLLLLCLTAGCDEIVELGDDCDEPGCTCDEPECACRDARQDLGHLPPTCDRERQTCDGTRIPGDEGACLDCLAYNADAGLGTTPLLTCACRHCAVQLHACRESPDEDSNQYCQSLVNCALREGCAGMECYCGDLDLEECRRADAGTGPCVRPIVAFVQASVGCEPGEREAACVLRVNETVADNPFHRAFVLSECVGNPIYGTTGNCPAPRPTDAGSR